MGIELGSSLWVVGGCRIGWWFMSDNVYIEGIWEGSHFLFIEIDICTTYDDHEAIETQWFVVYV